MNYVLDTDVLTLVELPDSPAYLRIRARAAELDAGDQIVTTIITYEEQTRGWLAYAAKSSATAHQVQAYARLKRHLEAYLKLAVLPFTQSAGQHFDRLHAMKLRVGRHDLRIAAITLSVDGVLVTRNRKDFSKVPGLRLQDWTRDP